MSVLRERKHRQESRRGPYEAHGQSKMGHCDRRDPDPGRCASLRLRDPARKGGYPPCYGRSPGQSPPPGSIGPSRPITNERPTSPSSPSSARTYPAQIGAISPDGQYIATGGSIIRDVAISSIAEKRIVRKFAINSGNVNAIAYSPDGRYLATGRGFMAHMPHNESVNIWDAHSGKLIRNLPGPAGPEENRE